MKIVDLHRDRIAQILLELKFHASNEEIPVGCAIYNQNGDKVTFSFNKTYEQRDSTSHAELLAIKSACSITRNANLSNHILYSTLEPCHMCLGAIELSSINKIVFGAFSSNTLIYTSLDDFRTRNKGIEVIGGVLEYECKEMISNWFKSIRKN